MTPRTAITRGYRRRIDQYSGRTRPDVVASSSANANTALVQLVDDLSQQSGRQTAHAQCDYVASGIGGVLQTAASALVRNSTTRSEIRTGKTSASTAPPRATSGVPPVGPPARMPSVQCPELSRRKTSLLGSTALL